MLQCCVWVIKLWDTTKHLRYSITYVLRVNKSFLKFKFKISPNKNNLLIIYIALTDRALFDRCYNFYLKTRRFSLTRVVGFQSQTCSVDDWMFSMLHGLHSMKLQSRCPYYSSTRQHVRASPIPVRVIEGCFARGKNGWVEQCGACVFLQFAWE